MLVCLLLLPLGLGQLAHGSHRSLDIRCGEGPLFCLRLLFGSLGGHHLWPEAEGFVLGKRESQRLWGLGAST